MEATIITEEKVVTTVGNFGDGRYSNIARELFRDSQRLLNLKPETADKLARAFVADFGRANSKCEKATVGSIKKDGSTTLSEATKAKGVLITRPLSIGKIVAELDKVRKLGIVSFGEIQLSTNEQGTGLADWLNEWVEPLAVSNVSPLDSDHTKMQGDLAER